MDKLGELIAHAEIGEEARKFMEGNLGKCIIGMADQERMAAEKALGRIDPDKKDDIIKLQRVVWNADHFEDWLMELISKGEEALEAYKQQRS